MVLQWYYVTLLLRCCYSIFWSIDNQPKERTWRLRVRYSHVTILSPPPSLPPPPSSFNFAIPSLYFNSLVVSFATLAPIFHKYVQPPVDGHEGDIYLEGRAARNRAYDGDTIVIRMLGEEHWKVMLQHFLSVLRGVLLTTNFCSL
jgi:hypothetical protein